MRKSNASRELSPRAKGIFIVVTVLLAVATVWLRLDIVKTSYEIGQADKQIHALKQEREKLELRTVELKSPRKLEPIAKQKFKLAPPSVDQIVYMNAAPKTEKR